MGNIGKIVAQKCYGMGMDVIVYDPYLKADENNEFEVKSNGRVVDFKVKVVALDELLKNADFISIHTPLTNETRGLLNYEKLSLIKDSSVLVNNSRGGVVIEEDLYKVLKEKKIQVGFDVFANEPLGKSNLLELDNFTCTPHISASTVEAQLQVAIDLYNQIKAFFIDGEMINILNK
jgi:D-3-phosphoglycerate dehydrogenase